MFAALLDHPLFFSHKPTTIQYVSIGAEIVTPDLIKRLKDKLGSDTVVWAIWGMTEGIGLLAWQEDEAIPSRSGLLSIGRVMPGAGIRICAEGSRQPLAVGMEGELHCTGASLICRYLDEPESDAFYIEGQRTWLATGDRALMDEEGCVFLLGQYKDIIVRGGENISPAALDSCLNRHQGVKVRPSNW